MKSLPLPRDVEDPAIAAVSRPSVDDVDRSSIGALQRGKGLAILRPGVMGLTVYCSLKCIGAGRESRFFGH